MLLCAGAGARTNESSGAFVAGTGVGTAQGLCPIWLRAGVAAVDFSVVCWVNPTSVANQGVVGMKNCWSLRFGSGFVSGRICQTGGASAAAADAGVSLAINQWNLVAMSWNSATKRVDTFVVNAANPNGVTANATAGAVTYQAPEDIRYAAQGQGDSSDLTGKIGTCAIMGRQTTLAECVACFAEGRYLSPWSYFMGLGSPPANYVVFGASMPSGLLKEDAATGGGWLYPDALAGTPGSPMTVGWPYIDSSRTRGTDLQTHRDNWTHQAGTAMVWKSHETEAVGAAGNFFVLPTVSGAAAVGGNPGPSSAAYNLSRSIAAKDVLICASNSRGVRRPAAGGNSRPENHMHGYIQAKESLIRGFINGRPNIGASSEAITWFGLGVALSETVQNSGTIQVVNTTTGLTDFTRGWTGGDNFSAGTIASGQGLYLAGSSSLGLKVSPENNSLMTGTAPLHVRYHVMRFPGCGAALSWKATTSASQVAGTDIAGATGTVANMDTQVGSRVFGASDTYNNGTKTLVFTGVDLVAQGLIVGHLIVNGSRVSAAEVASASVAGGNTTVVLRHVLGQTPQTNDVLYFGPWHVSKIEYDFDGSASYGGRDRRGLVLTTGALATNTLGVILLAIDAWNPNAVGTIIGQAGYSGNGYQNHIDDSWSLTLTKFYTSMFNISDAVSFSLFMHHADQQVFSPGGPNYAAIVQSVQSECSIVYCGDPVHELDSAVINWDTAVLGTTGRLAVTITSDTRFGTNAEQIARGFCADAPHLSALGQLRCSQANLDRFLTLASLQNRRSGGGHSHGQSVRAAQAAVAAMSVIDETLFIG